MQGIGNDYVYVDAFQNKIAAPDKLAIRIADRHFGVGGDGLILVAPPTTAAQGQGAEVRMRMFNADGSESEMCGNGVRCVAKYAYDHGITRSNPMKVETGRGVLTISLEIDAATDKVRSATVNMGQPILDLPLIPVDAEWLAQTGHPHEYQIVLDPEKRGNTARGEGGKGGITHGIPATFVSMGNPHAVIFTPDVKAVDLEKIGPQLEHHHAFPRRMNVHFVQVVAAGREDEPGEMIMRTWERGSGITLACGTGASAVCVAGVLMGKAARRVLIHLPGGDLHLEWRKADDCVYMTGSATEVFTGDWPE